MHHRTPAARVRRRPELRWVGVGAALALGAGCSSDPDVLGLGRLDAGAEPGGDADSHAILDVPRLDGAVDPPEGSVTGDFRWQLPAGWPRPPVPADNPMSNEKVELGRHLFYESRLSSNGTTACSSCHKQEIAFTDGRPVAIGATGQLHTRGSMSLANVGYAQTLTWGDPELFRLELQLLVPLFGAQPEELANTSVPELEARLRDIPRYEQLFSAAFPGEAQPITIPNLGRALAAFQRTLISGDSPYDKFQRGDESALSDAARRGMRLVTTNEDHRFECNHCHGTLFFSDHVTWEGRSARGQSPPYHQTGLYDIDGNGGYPAPNTGTHAISGRPEDMGMFKAPTLRNIALTAPYMHDGSLATLSDVLDHYAQGGRAHVPGRTDALLQPFPITDAEKADIIAFLESLTDQTFTREPRFTNPWLNEAASR